MIAPHPNALATASRNRPTLSVLIPILREDPGPLIALLREEIVAKDIAPRVEVLVFDDGGEDLRLAARIEATLSAQPMQGRLLVSDATLGRAAARNRLAAAARGAWFLFLDADMRPDPRGFLTRWLEVIAQDQPWIALGGLGRRVHGSPGRGALERALAHGGEPRPTSRGPAASLLVRCEILASEPFDESFLGRGWEDVEWAMRARRHAPVQLVDIAASTAAPDAPAERERCRSSARNFARLVRRHPRFARALPAFYAAQLFAHAPGLTRLRPLLERAARRTGPLTPPGVRALAADLWRASWYGEALR